MPTFDELTLIGRLGGTLLVPERHRVIEHNQWLESLKRQMALQGYLNITERMFLYHHLIEDTIVLAFWRVSSEDGRGFCIMQELWAMRCLPGEEKSTLKKWLGSREHTPTLDEIEPMLRPAREVIEECQRTLKEADDTLKAKDATNEVARAESDRFLKQRGMGGIPAAIPFVVGEKDEFTEPLKGKVTY